jgi:F0F1-type ATP synthase membrane subunit b/b'
MQQSRAGEIAAQQVTEIVKAAEAAAEQIERDALERAQAELESVRAQAEQELAQARARVAALEERSRDRALELEDDTKREVERRLSEALEKAAAVKERPRRSVDGRVERADAAAAEMVAHAEAVSAGLRKLGELLTEQGERILRDTRSARKQLRAQMDSAIEGHVPAPPSRDRPSVASDDSTPTRRRRLPPEAARARDESSV